MGLVLSRDSKDAAFCNARKIRIEKGDFAPVRIEVSTALPLASLLISSRSTLVDQIHRDAVSRLGYPAVGPSRRR